MALRTARIRRVRKMRGSGRVKGQGNEGATIREADFARHAPRDGARELVARFEDFETVKKDATRYLQHAAAADRETSLEGLHAAWMVRSRVAACLCGIRKDRCSFGEAHLGSVSDALRWSDNTCQKDRLDSASVGKCTCVSFRPCPVWA